MHKAKPIHLDSLLPREPVSFAPLPAHVVLFQPEIPQNTGNVGRTCVALGVKLWIVQPAGFQIDDAKIRRSGLDYWQYLDFEVVPHWEALTELLDPARFYFLSRFARRTLWEATFTAGDVFVFGRESSGLPAHLLNQTDERALRLPTSEKVRSLNLGTTVGIVLYEHARQNLFG